MARSPRMSLEALRPYLVDLPHPRSPAWRLAAATPPALIWSQLFGHDRPVEIEVGFGKGMFLVNSGTTRPEVNFLGVEIERKYALLTATRLARRGLTNVRLACTDARWLLERCVADASVQAVHVYFPDPWWKQRHRKRKLFTPDFARQCGRILRPGGTLHFVSDVAAYFDETRALVTGQGLLRPLAEPDRAGGVDEYLTHFERKYRREGRPIWRATFVR